MSKNVDVNNNNNNNNDNMNSQTYLNICNDFKTIIDKKERDLKEFKVNYFNLKKKIGKMYGGLKILNDHINSVFYDATLEPFIVKMLEILNDDCEDIIFGEEEAKLDIDWDSDMEVDDLDEVDIN